MPKKSRKTAKSKMRTKRTIPHRATQPVKTRTEEEIAALAAPAHAQRFVDDVLTRGEAAPLVRGKLPLGKTHILETRKGAAPKITRVRFSLTG